MKKITLLFALLLSLAMASTVSAQTTLSTPTVKSAFGVTTTGLTANWTALPALSGATGYDVKIYDASNTLVSTHNASGETTATLAITGLSLAKSTPYTYTVTAIGDGGFLYNNSAATVKSIPFYIQTDNKVVFKYAVADTARLFIDMKSASGASGAADIYELTESGGAYTYVTTNSNNIVLTKNTTVRAAAGLAARPIIKLNSTATGSSTTNIFYTATLGLTLRFDGLEFDGVNPGVGGYQPMAIYDSSIGASNIQLYITNCYFHDFKAASGNGAIRLNGVSSSQLLDIQGSTFNAIGGRSIYLNNGSAGTTTVVLKNNTFSNSVTLATNRNNVIYNNNGNSGTVTIDHCTFYKVADATVTNGVIRTSGSNGAITIKNSTFVTVPTTIGSGTISYCYLAGLNTVPTATNTIATAPTYGAGASSTPPDLSLTNRGSLVGQDGLTAGNDTYYNLAMPTIGAGSGATSASFNANWSTVSNASSYDVIVYQNGTQIGSVRNASGQAAATLAITGLDASTAYTYRVMAKGDGTTYFNSVISAESAAYSTLAPSGITLNTPLASAATDITPIGFTANWSNTDANASGGYNVKVYSGVTLVNTYNTSSLSATSLVINTGLTYNTAYTYTVTAVGNGSTYTNSIPSDVISVTTIDRITLEPPTAGAATPASNGFTANWSADAAASSFSIKTYIESNLVSTTTSGSGTTSVAVSSLLSGLDYTYTVTAIGDGASYVSSAASTPQSFTTTGRIISITTDFSDVAAWGTPALAVPANGSFFTGTINGFDLNAATLNAISSIKGPKGETHTNRISLDKNSTGANVIFPTIASVGQLEIHFAMGTAANTVNLKEYSSATNTWSTIGTYAYDLANKTAGIDQIIIVSFAPAHTNAKFKIENNTGGSCYLAQVIARTTNPLLLTAPTVGTASDIAAVTCTANWTPVDANASNYEVKVYKGTTLKVTATTSGGQATSSLAITGLQADSTYTYKVKALGNGDVDYSDSYQSAASEPFTMASQLATPIMDVATNVWKYGLDANWLAVVGAVSYDVSLYQGVTLIATHNVLAPIVTSTFSSLTPETIYTYKVVAKGTGSAPFDSNVSAASAEVLTDLATAIRNANAASTVVLSGKTITASQLGNMQIYNLQGELILQANAVNKVDTNLSSGMYVVRFTNQNGKQTTQKFVVR